MNDLAAALIHLMKLENPPDWVNAGLGEEVSILQLARMIAETVGFEGKVTTDPTRPDGTPRKLCDNSLLRSTGWQLRIRFREGLQDAYQHFLAENEQMILRAK